MREILIPVTFREFDGSFDAQIQEMWLERLKQQTYQNYKLVVTSFREKNVQATLAKSGIPHVFYQSDRNCLFSVGDMITNTIKHIEPGKNIIFWTTADHMYDNDLFEKINEYFVPGEGGTSFPNPEYYGVQAFEKGEMFDEYFLDPVKSIFGYDPNLHLPEAFYLDGDLWLDQKNQYYFDKYPLHGLFPGIGLTLYVAMTAPRLRNLVFVSKIHKVSNDKKVPQASKQNPEQFNHYWGEIEKMCLEKGTPKSLIYGTPLLSRKWLMHLQYKPYGTPWQVFSYYMYFLYYAIFPKRRFVLAAKISRLFSKFKGLKTSDAS